MGPCEYFFRTFSLQSALVFIVLPENIRNTHMTNYNDARLTLEVPYKFSFFKKSPFPGENYDTSGIGKFPLFFEFLLLHAYLPKISPAII